MKKKYLYWIPRIITIVFTIFISLFALDVFGEYLFPDVLAALFMHLIPTFVLIAMLLVAWKWEHVGGTLFLVAGIIYILMVARSFKFISLFIISSPLFFIGVLFLVYWYTYKKENKKNEWGRRDSNTDLRLASGKVLSSSKDSTPHYWRPLF